RYGLVEVMSEIKPALQRPASMLLNYEPTSAEAFRGLASRHALYPGASEDPGSFEDLVRATLDPTHQLTTRALPGRALTAQRTTSAGSAGLIRDYGSLSFGDIAREIARRAKEPIESELYSRALARHSDELIGQVLATGRHRVGAARAVNTQLEAADVSLMRGNTEYPALANPFQLAQGLTREESIELFGRYLRGNAEARTELRALKVARKPGSSERVRKLGCHCWPLPCHCDLIAEIVNAGERFEELSFGDVAESLVRSDFVREERDENGRIERQGDLGSAFRGLVDFHRLSRASFGGRGRDWKRWRSFSERPGGASFQKAQLFLGEKLASLPREARESLIGNDDPLRFIARTTGAGLLPAELRAAVMDLAGQVERARHEAATLATAEASDPRGILDELYDVQGVPASADLGMVARLLGRFSRASGEISRGGHLAPLLMEGTPLWEREVAPYLRVPRGLLPSILTSESVGEAVPPEVLASAKSHFGGLLQEQIVVRSALEKAGVDPSRVRLVPKERLRGLFPSLSADESERFLGRPELLGSLVEALEPPDFLPEQVRYEPALHDEGPLRWLRRPGRGERGPTFRDTLGSPYTPVGPQSGELTDAYREHVHQLLGIRFPKRGESLSPEGQANLSAFVRALGGLPASFPPKLIEPLAERVHRTVTGLEPFYFDVLKFAQKAWEHNGEGGVPLESGERVKLGDYAQRTLDQIARIVEPERVKSLTETKSYLEDRLYAAAAELGALQGTPEAAGPLANLPLADWFPPGEAVGRLNSGESIPGANFAAWEPYLGRYQRDEQGEYLRDDQGELVPYGRSPRVAEPELQGLRGEDGRPLWDAVMPNPHILGAVKGPLGLSYDELRAYYERARPGRDRLTMGRAFASAIRSAFAAEAGVQTYLRHRYTGSGLDPQVRELLGELARSPGEEGGFDYGTIMQAGIPPHLLETPSIPEMRLALEGGWWGADHPSYWERYAGVNEQLADVSADSHSTLRDEALQLRAVLAKPPVAWPYTNVTERVGDEATTSYRTALPWLEPEASPPSLLDAAGV
ncbi:MAG TPA: DUF4326 domain-containing protein, partial [Anaeromyxobacteraceae bacterium]|nr:DUF4326 domain-containing protein [Anaeromyxobacteraceae bacterium]